MKIFNKKLYNKILRSVLFALFALLTIILVNFFLPRLMPGDPVLSLIGAEDSEIDIVEYEYYYNALGLDKPLFEQFGNYLGNLFIGNMGYSYHYATDVSEIIAQKIPRTLQIALPAWIFSALLAYFLGTLAGYRKNKLLDRTLTNFNIIINVIPTFLIAIIMVIVFAYEFHILPYGNLNSTIPPTNGFLYFLDRVKHLILPVLTIVIVSTPSKYVLMRNTTAAAMNEKYLIYANARGINDRTIRGKHIFTNVGQPFISLLGTSFGKTLSGSIIVEIIFSIDGMGMLVNTAIGQRDFVVIQATLFVIACSVIFSNLIADIICILIDPKQRLGGI